MFGYVTVCADELKIKDYNRYKAYYCGVCKALGRNYSQFSRLGLSYDITFLCIMLDALFPDDAVIENIRCLKHIGRKRRAVMRCKPLDYCCDIAILLAYYKIKDDISDGFSPKSRALLIPYRRIAKKAMKRQKYAAESIKSHLAELSVLEKTNSDNIDAVSDCFARLTEDLFCCSEETGRFGYNIGRFIYLIDAIDDYEKDFKDGNYNPYIAKFGSDRDAALQSAEMSIMITLSQAAEQYEKIKKYKNKEILDNIVYFGLRQKVFSVLKGKSDGKSV